MKRRNMEDILDECLEAVRRGGAVEECLSRYAEYAAELRELLTVARVLERCRAGSRISPGLAAALGTVRVELERRRTPRRLLDMLRLVRPFIVPAAAVCAAVALVIMTIRALPGDVLYPAKSAAEELLARWSGNDHPLEVDMRLADARMTESHAAAKRRGRVDGAALASVHTHAETALGALDRIPEHELPSALARIEVMHRRHLEMLNDMRTRVRGSQVSEVDRSIQRCSARMEWVGRIRTAVVQSSSE